MPELEMIGFLALGRPCDAVEEYFSEKVSERVSTSVHSQ